MKWTLKTIDKMIEKAENKPETNIPLVTEVCEYCENEVTLKWDIEHDGNAGYCPCCGKLIYFTNKEKASPDNE